MTTSPGTILMPDSNTRYPRKPSSRFGSTFKKIGQYLRDQALDQSQSALYLTPATRESQHRISSRSTDQYLGEGIGNASRTQRIATLKSSVSLLPHNQYCPAKGPAPAYTHASARWSSSMTTNGSASAGIFQNMIRHQYASDNILQSYDVLQSQRTSGKPWLVYIHGGYFRDPKVDSTSFKSTISLLEASALNANISGYASINYRLSPHPAYPQEPTTTPSYTLNAARWPDQPNDILAALRHLQQHYPNSRNYILIGHSVGATLAFLTALNCHSAGLAAPRALLGVSGIYDFPAIHESNPDYEAITSNAMDPRFYDEASPKLYHAETYARKWVLESTGHSADSGKRIVVLAHSRDDGLVGWDQVEDMQAVFSGVDEKVTTDIRVELVELRGAHNTIWEGGTEMVRAVEAVLRQLD